MVRKPPLSSGVGHISAGAGELSSPAAGFLGLERARENSQK